MPGNGSVGCGPMLPVPMVKVKVTIPDALVLSFAVTVTLEVVVAVGVPEISPEELMLSPAAGRSP